MKVLQDNLYHEFNTDTQLIDILWILEIEDSQGEKFFYQKTKSLHAMYFPRIMAPEASRKPVDAFKSDNPSQTAEK